MLAVRHHPQPAPGGPADAAPLARCTARSTRRPCVGGARPRTPPDPTAGTDDARPPRRVRLIPPDVPGSGGATTNFVSRSAKKAVDRRSNSSAVSRIRSPTFSLMTASSGTYLMTVLPRITPSLSSNESTISSTSLRALPSFPVGHPQPVDERAVEGQDQGVEEDRVEGLERRLHVG